MRLRGHEFVDSRIVEKILVIAPERYEATITTLENIRDATELSLAALLNALRAQEQRKQMREESVAENALPARHQNKPKDKFNEKESEESDSSSKATNQKGKKKEFRGKIIHRASVVVKWDILLSSVGRDQMQNALNATTWDTRQ